MDRRPKTRTRRFTLPATDDSRVHRVVEGLLSEPAATDHPGRGRKAAKAANDPLAMLMSRVDWLAAMEHEQHRHARYERPVAVVVVELAHARDADRAVRLAARVLLRESREMDRVARVGPRRLQILLPETRERGLQTYVERLCVAWSGVEQELGGHVAMRVGSAATRNGESIRDLLQRAEKQLS
jgi:diguanylate cyclase (GGDEF)-like protein